MGISRSTFVIDADGNVVKAMHNVKPDGHPQKVLEGKLPFVSDSDYSRRGFLTKAGVTLGAAPLIGLVQVEDAMAAPPPTVYDVASYGAQGDGTTDDTNAIQAAIDAANARGGGTIVFPGGTFRITRSLTIYSRILFRGAGMRATVLKKGPAVARVPDPEEPGLRPAGR